MYKLTFYFWLLFKKIRTFLYIKFEKKVLNDLILSDENFKNILWAKIKKNLIAIESNTFYRTKIKNKELPNNLAQARVLLSAILLLNEKNQINHLSTIINRLKNYLLSVKTKNNLWLFNQKWWNKQDEGIATIWVLLALLEVYKLNKNDDLLKEIISSTEAMNEMLFSKSCSLRHNLGDSFWCLNAASTYAMYISKLLEFTNKKEYVENLNLSIKLCLDNITDEGFFPYSEIRKGTYLLLYNPIVIITLKEALKSNFIYPELKKRSIKDIEIVKNFVYKQKDKDYFFVEPEQEKFARYIISNITSLIALKDIITNEEETKIFNNIKSYIIDNELYLCRNEKGEYFNGNLYEVRDVLLTEVFYWFTYYNYNLK